MDAIMAYSAAFSNGVRQRRFSSQVQGGAPVQSSDKVDISEFGQAHAGIHKAISKATDVRMDKLKDLSPQSRRASTSASPWLRRNS